MPPLHEIERFNDAEALVAATVDRWLHWVHDAARQSGKDENQEQKQRLSVALSGGRITEKLFRETSVAARAQGVTFSEVDFFWADERCVPPDHTESNYAMAARELLAPLAIAERCIHRIPGEWDPSEAARAAEETMRSVLGTASDAQPILDLVFLGMGEDGHVASLFPDALLEVTENPAVYQAVIAVKPPPQRVTLNYATLAAARDVWVVVSGAGKEMALSESIRPDGNTPLARVLRDRGNGGTGTRILTDCP